MHEQKELYASKIFFNAALPLLKVIATDVPSLKAKFDKLTTVLQVSALDPEAEGGKYATHFIITEGEWETKLNAIHEAPDVELEFKSIEAIIYSMTPKERTNPEILNGSRRNRIAKGSGTDIQEVNRLIKQFDQTRKMMKMITGGNMAKMMGKMPKMPNFKR